MEIILKRIRYFVVLYVYWVCIFLLDKILFLFYHFNTTNNYSFKEVFNIFYHGLPMDMSAAGYLMLLPAIIIALPFKGIIVKKIMGYYLALMLFIISFVMIADLEVYKWWGYRIDYSALVYLKTPWMILSSLKTVNLIILILASCILLFFFYKIYKNTVAPLIDDFEYKSWYSLTLLVFFSLIFIPIRGGFDVAPMNIGNAYFHSDPFINHASVNVLWNLGFSLTDKNQTENYNYFSENELQNKIEQLQSPSHNDSIKYLKNDQPNIVFIVLESFTSKLIEPLGGVKGVTPNINNLVNEGILFNNFYANNSRSDKGMVSIFSGYPSLPGITVTNYHKKNEKISAVPRCLKGLGYETAFYYGGDIDFANLRAYLINAGFDKLVIKDDFPKTSYNSKWGVHDHVMFDTLFDQINKAKTPFLYTLFTLSSHEPFDVPMKPVFKGNTALQKFKNTVYYTDSCLGHFIEKARNTNWWDNTLFVLVADHGSRLPGNDPSCFPAKHKIPMLWLGGALKVKDTVISKYGSQVDIPVTLLNQLGQESRDFAFGKNLLNPHSPSYAFYFCDKGVGFVNDSSTVAFNSKINKVVYNKEDVKPAVEYAKAIIQYIAEHFNKL